MAKQYTLQINIAREDLQYLQEKKQNLCLSKDAVLIKTTVPGNVVFSGILSNDLERAFSLHWREDYRVFGTMHFEPGAIVTYDTETRMIGENQTATLKKDGTVGVVDPPRAGMPFRVENLWTDPARIGVNTYDALNNRYSSFYVSPRVPLLERSKTDILPLQSYSIFWDAELETGLMFDNEKISDRFSFEFEPGEFEITLTYKDRKWGIVA